MPQTKYYFRITNEVITDKRLTITERIIYAYISNFWHFHTTFNASNKSIAFALGISRRSVINAINHLTELNYIYCYYLKCDGANTLRQIQPPQPKTTLTGESELEKLFNSVYGKITGKNTENK